MILKRVTIFGLIAGLSAATFGAEYSGAGIDLGTWKLPPNKSNSLLGPGAITPGWWAAPWTGGSEFNLNPGEARFQYTTQAGNLSFKRRLLSTPGNAYLDAGIGIQKIDLDQHPSRDGLRLSLDGSMGIGHFMTLYGESTWVPGLIESGGFENLTGLEFETGVMLNPFPYLSIRAAYRRFNLDYSLTNGTEDYSTSQGFMIGTGIHW